MLDLIAGTYNSVKAATEIVQGLVSLKTEATVSTKVVELNRIIADIQRNLLGLQTEYSAVVSRESELKSQIVNLKSWEEDKKCYQLHELVPGTLVYRIKPGMENGEPFHYLCTGCCQQNVKSILQKHESAGYRESHWCPFCKTVFLGEKIKLSNSVGRY